MQAPVAAGKSRDEVLDQIRWPLNFDSDSCGRVADVSTEVSIDRKPVDSGRNPTPCTIPDTWISLRTRMTHRAADIAARELCRLRSSQASHAAIPWRAWQDTNNLHVTVDAARIFLGSSHIEWHVGQQVDFV